ncbi:MAG: DUF4129 domain-containing protein [Cystobacter sp.]
MAISALELRPRGPIALMDAALRLCMRGSGLWALTLPGGVLVTAALLHLTDAVTHRRDLALPVLGLTLAWFVRGLFQGAACHHVQQWLLGPDAGIPPLRSSLSAALAHAPGLWCTVAYLFVFNTVTFCLTLGASHFFLASHLVGHAVAVQGLPSAPRLYGECARRLGPARVTAIGVRLLLLSQGLVLLNLHLAAAALIYVGRQLLGIELTFVDRFASLDNPSWDVFLVAMTFTLFEPLRAASAALLLVNGRVRQEGADLLAAVQRIPTRAPALGLLVVLGLGLGLLAPAAHAQPPEARSASPEELWRRVETLATACELEPATLDTWRRSITAVSAREAPKVERLVRSVERQMEEEEDCAPVDRLYEGLALAQSTAELERREDAAETRTRARDILARPEFQVPEPKPPGEEPPPDEPVPEGWWDRFWKKIAQWLKELLRDRQEPMLRPDKAEPGGQAVAHALVVLLITCTLGVLAAVLWRAFKGREDRDGGTRLEVSTQSAATLAADPMNALARPPEGWAHLADELAARGQYREAVRGLYLALLSRLHREGAIHYDPHASNWDYLRQFRGRHEWKPSLRELTLRFDSAWYGNLPVGEHGYRDFRTLCAPMLTPSAPTEPARA